MFGKKGSQKTDVIPEFRAHKGSPVKYFIARNALRLSLVVLIIIIALLAKPAFVGFKLEKEFKEVEKTPQAILSEVNVLRSENDQLKVKLDTYELTNDEIRENLGACEREKLFVAQNFSTYVAACEQNEREMTSQHAHETELQQEEIQRVIRESTEKQEEADRIIQNAANNICCKRKVDDPSISHYVIANERIVCMDSGEHAISC